MAGNPKISVIIPTFNSGAYLPETLASILAQSLGDYEVILVDDGSTDNTREIVRKHGDRVQYVYQDNSGGPARPRNVAISRARGDYICIFDSDDLMLPDKLARSVEFFDAHPDFGLIFTNFVKFDDRGTLPGTHMDAYTNFWSLPKEQLAPDQYRIRSAVAFESLFYGNYVGTSSVVAPAAVFREVGLFDEVATRGGLEDRDMWFRIARLHDFGFLNMVGHMYRVRPASVSSRTILSAEARIAVIRKHLSPELPAAARRQARAVVSESYFNMGGQYWLEGNLSTARRYFWQSVLERPTLSALRWLVLSFVGNRALAAWRQTKARMRKAGSKGPV